MVLPKDLPCPINAHERIYSTSGPGNWCDLEHVRGASQRCLGLGPPIGLAAMRSPCPVRYNQTRTEVYTQNERGSHSNSTVAPWHGRRRNRYSRSPCASRIFTPVPSSVRARRCADPPFTRLSPPSRQDTGLCPRARRASWRSLAQQVDAHA